MAVVLGDRPVISATMRESISVDGWGGGDGYLDAGELFTGTPTITEAGLFVGESPTGAAVYTASTDLTITNKSVNEAVLVINGNTVDVGQALQCKISGQQAGNTYGIRFTCDTDAGRRVCFDVLVKVA